MFKWDKSIQKLDVSAEQILQLFRSMRDVQLALPGQQVQQATAFLCQYRTKSGVATVAAFHLQKSRQLAFYCSDPLTVTEGRADLMFDSGLNFVESMGFLLSDMDLQLLSDEDRQLLWSSLPIAKGFEEAEAQKDDTPLAKPAEEPVQVGHTAISPEPAVVKTEVVALEPKAGMTSAPEVPAAVDNQASMSPLPAESFDDGVDDLLAAVEAMRAKRPGLRARRKTLKPVELKKRRLDLRENIGRILASL